MTMKPSRLHRAEPLEPRLALAGLHTFTDVDGDLIAVRSSRGTDADLAAAVSFVPAGVGQQLRLISITNPVFMGTDLSVAVRTRAAGGDGRVNVGGIHTAMNLGAVTVRGDLGRVEAVDLTSNSISKLTVGSIGKLGTSTGAINGISVVSGSIGSLKIEGDLDKASFNVGQRLEKAVVGGSIIGANTGDGIAAGGIGSISVGRSLFGGAQNLSGRIATTTAEIGRVRIGGDLVGGSGAQSGMIMSAKGLLECRIAGGIFGGFGEYSGRVSAGGGEAIGTITVGSSVVGGMGDNSAIVSNLGEIRKARIGGSLVGGGGASSGVVFAEYGIGKISIVGDIRGGTGGGGGRVVARDGLIGQLDVRSIMTGDGAEGAAVIATLLGQVTVRGHLLGSATRTVTIMAKGSAWSSAATIGSVRVLGNVFRANVLAGYDFFLPVNGTARIGTVAIGGMLSQSSIAAGVQNPAGIRFLGTAGDAAVDGGVSRIDVVAVGGRATGSGALGESFGVVAGSIGRVRIAGTRFTPAAGSFTYPSADNFAIHVL
jgi:hypothetical protein